MAVPGGQAPPFPFQDFERSRTAQILGNEDWQVAKPPVGITDVVLLALFAIVGRWLQDSTPEARFQALRDARFAAAPRVERIAKSLSALNATPALTASQDEWKWAAESPAIDEEF